MEIILRVPDWLITVSEEFVNTFCTKENLWHLLVALLLYVAFISVLWCMGRLMESMENRILILGLGPLVTLYTFVILAILGVPDCCLLSLLLMVGFTFTLWCVRIVKRLWRYLDNLEQNGKAEEKPEEELKIEICSQDLPTYEEALVSAQGAAYEEKKINVFIITMPEETK